MMNLNYEGILFLSLGLLMTIRFRWWGRHGVEQGKKFDKSLHGKYWNPKKEEAKYGKTAVLFNQIFSLIVGVLFIIIGLGKLFN